MARDIITLHVYSTHTGEISGSDHLPSWREALRIAYAVVKDNPAKVAHLFPTGSTTGLYIARHDDETRPGWTDLDTMAQQAERKFSLEEV